MPRVLFHVDISKKMDQQEVPGHNRWHPDIPAVVSVKPGEVFRIECLEWTDGQIGDNDSANDVRDVDLTRVHVLSGPIAVEGAEPGDLLVVDILDIGPFPFSEWGYNGIFAKTNGGGFLTEHYPDAYKSVWNFQGIYATSRHIPDVRFAGITHPGLMGTAPSQDLLNQWNYREKQLIETNPNRVPPLAEPPTPHSAVLGKLKGAEFDRIAKEGARTIPPREHGGNVDIKNLSRGSRVFFPVYIRGANLSVGDLHFSQGDGEITFCGAIEMAGWLDLEVNLIKDGMNKYSVVNPIFKPGPEEPRYSEYLAFQGISVDEQGKQHYLDSDIAYRRACLNAIEYLKKFGYSGPQAYMILGSAPVEGRLSGVVDIPNSCCTIYIPTEIFQRNVLPSTPPDAPQQGQAAATS